MHKYYVSEYRRKKKEKSRYVGMTTAKARQTGAPLRGRWKAPASATGASRSWIDGDDDVVVFLPLASQKTLSSSGDDICHCSDDDDDVISAEGRRRNREIHHTRRWRNLLAVAANCSVLTAPPPFSFRFVDQIYIDSPVDLYLLSLSLSRPVITGRLIEFGAVNVLAPFLQKFFCIKKTCRRRRRSLRFGEEEGSADSLLVTLALSSFSFLFFFFFCCAGTI